MKLILATIQEQDSDRVISALTGKKYRVTRIGSTGGFLQEGNTTLLIGVEDAQVTEVIALLQHTSQRRTRLLPVPIGATPNGNALYNYAEVTVGGAAVFVLEVDQFEQY
jgi:uncharacterized protein YaaQ